MIIKYSKLNENGSADMFNKHGGYYGEGDIIDYSININPFGVSEKLKSRLFDEIENLEKYPEINGDSMLEKLSARLNINKDGIIIGNGATELIYLFSRAICSDGKKTVVLEPTFSEYKKSVEVSGGIVKSIGNGHDLSLDELKRIIKNEISAVFICSPNNPDGKVFSYEKLEELLSFIEEEKLETSVFLDESFIEFTDEKSAIDLIEKYRLFILKSVTKIYGVPGIRIGYGVGNPGIVAEMNRFKEPWTVNHLALKTIDTYLEDMEYLDKTKKWINQEKHLFYNELKQIEEIELFDMSANYIMFRMKKGSGEQLKDYLLEKGFYIRLCGDFYGLDDEHIRLAVRYREQNKKLVDSIKKYFQSLK